jgi:hypothetical protein
MLCFLHIYKKFVLATVMNRQPVSRDKNRRDRVIFPFSGDKTCCTVLYTL